MIVDDDLLSREVVSLLASEAGFHVHAHETGEDAIRALSEGRIEKPVAVLADMQMPGISGDALAQELRAACGWETKLLAISGTAVPKEAIREFDGFLMKPFQIEEVISMLESREVAESAVEEAHTTPGLQGGGLLNMDTYLALAESMPRDQLHKLYEMCLSDAEQRLKTLRQASRDKDPKAWKQTAHSIKGGCGMLGLSELASIAARWESEGLPEVDSQAPFDNFLEVSGELRRILDAQ